jgi:hypothetical protein
MPASFPDKAALHKPVQEAPNMAGNAAREISDDLLDGLASGYREAVTVTTASR